MMCAPSWKQALLGTALFVGWASTLLWLPRFGDMYGRKWIFAFGMTLNLLMYTIMMVTTDMNTMIISIFIQGALNSIRCNIGFMYFLELLPKYIRTTCGTV